MDTQAQLPSLYATATFRSQWLHTADLDAPLEHKVRYVRRSPTEDHEGESPASGILSQSTLAHADPFQVAPATSDGLNTLAQSHMADVVQRLGIAGWYAETDGDAEEVHGTPTPGCTENIDLRRLSPIKEGNELAEDVYIRMAWIATRASRIPRYVPRSRRSSRRVSCIPRPSTTAAQRARREEGSSWRACTGR
ncbi:hypothetical protein PENSPDRAFT_759680 [Peniophora sp. CONT]|nr:hypothetical protein PENSPDRAFT_759680 [Peniophora sp. CONT]